MYGPSSSAAAAAVLQIINDRSVADLIDHTQALVRESEYVRKDYWKNADRASRDPAKWETSLKPYRDYFYDEVLGRFEHVKLPPNARTRVRCGAITLPRTISV